MKLAIVDVETVGLDPERHDIWEIAVELRNSGSGDSLTYVWEIRPDLSTADPFALRVGRYFERRSLELPTGSEARELVRPGAIREPDMTPPPATRARIAAELAEIFRDAVLVASNPAFDAAFLAAFLRENGQCPTWNYHLVDVRALAIGWLTARGEYTPGRWLDMPTFGLWRELGIDPDAFETHTALGDVRLAAAVYDAIAGSPS